MSILPSSQETTGGGAAFTVASKSCRRRPSTDSGFRPSPPPPPPSSRRCIDCSDEDKGEYQTNELLHLIRSRFWSLALDRVASNPEEARRAFRRAASSAPYPSTTTALSEVVRLGCGRSEDAYRSFVALIRSLVHADPNGLTSWRHPQLNTLIHEAIDRMIDTRILRFMVESVVEMEAKQSVAYAQMPEAGGASDSECEKGGNTTKMNATGETLFARTNRRGETIVHLLCVRACASWDAAFIGGGMSSDLDDVEEWKDLLEIIRLAADAYPKAISVPNRDGMSALSVVLAADFRRGEMEKELTETIEKDSRVQGDRVLDLVRLLLSVQPEAVIDLTNRQHMARWRHRCSSSRQPAPNPISLSLLNRHSPDVVQLLLSSCCRHDSVAARNALVRHVVTPEEESPLHLALTMRCDDTIIEMLLENGGSVTAAWEDAMGMTPLCWAWARHVLDRPFRAKGTRTGYLFPVKKSRRRYFPTNYTQALMEATKEVEAATLDRSTGGRGKEESSGEEDEDPYCHTQLWEKVKLLLPHAASARWNDAQLRSGEHKRGHEKGEERMKRCHPSSTRRDSGDKDRRISPVDSGDENDGPSSWPTLHAASYAASPRPLFLLSLHRHPSHLCQIDARGNIPLHYAASRARDVRGYHHVTYQPSCEPSAVYDLLSRFANGARIYNAQKRLALHLAINATQEPDVIMYILRCFPEASERRDGVTGLYPFMQSAAAGEGKGQTGGKHNRSGPYRVNVTYLLLRRLPNLVSLGIPTKGEGD